MQSRSGKNASTAAAVDSKPPLDAPAIATGDEDDNTGDRDPKSNLGDEPPADEKQLARVAELMDKDVMVLDETQLARIQQRNAHPFTISVHSTFRHWWDFFISISTAYVIFTTPIRVGFMVNSQGPAYVLDVIVDIMYLVEIVLSLFTSYIDDTTGEEVKKLSSIRRNYLSSFFLIDAMSSFPTSLTGSDNVLLNLIKLLKVVRVLKLSETGLFKSISQRVNRSMNPSLMRMLSLTFIFLLSQHYIADSSLMRQYTNAMYFALMVTTANDVGPTNTTEKIFTSLMLFVGIVINASIIGSAANLLANLDKVAIARKNQMDSINDYMRFKKVPLALQDKIRRYYEYALSTRIVDPTQTLFADLPDRLKLSLRLTLHDTFIRKVPLFRVCSNAGVIAIVQCLHPVVAMPYEVILGQGEMAEVKSDAITELAFLEKADFLALIDKFPTFHLAVRRICESRMQTAQNVHRMTKMRRPSQVLQPGMHGSKGDPVTEE
ncbi:hypothetical protein ATCC90586_008297 [Pythium insidiosum]|nr:hypothetical protein ATCC90586_008297 [Pythium insidiosum]